MKLAQKYLKYIIAICIAIAIIIINLLIFFQPLIFVLAFVLAVVPFAYEQYIFYTRVKEIEERFPDFLVDVSENIHAGMTLPQAIKSVKNKDYGALSPFVKKAALQIDRGVPFNEIFEMFSKLKSKAVQRAISTLIEVHRSGGDIAEALSLVARTSGEIEKLKKERYSSVYSQVLTGYIVYILFLGILVVMKIYLFPSFGFIVPEAQMQTSYSSMFSWLILIQGFFSGIAIGKMSEGSVVAGLKHSLVLVLLGFSVIGVFL